MYNPDAGPMRHAENYGGVEITLKPEVLARTTITLGDSLRPMQQGTVLPSPATDPNWKSSVDVAMVKDLYHAENVGQVQHAAGYVESQVHGPVELKDIASIRLAHVYNPDPIRAAAVAAGIPIVE